jgi:hypothetical protein
MEEEGRREWEEKGRRHRAKVSSELDGRSHAVRGRPRRKNYEKTECFPPLKLSARHFQI